MNQYLLVVLLSNAVPLLSPILASAQADGLYTGIGLGISKYKAVDTTFVAAQLAATNNGGFITTDSSGQPFRLLPDISSINFSPLKAGMLISENPR